MVVHLVGRAHLTMILFIKHIDIEGPGTLGDFFSDRGYITKTIDLGAGDRLPISWDGIKALVILGGPMNVDEEDKYPFLKAEDSFIQEALAQEIPLLGICLGAQLLAKACRASVGKSPQKEIGFFSVELTSAGVHDPLFQGLERKLEVFQWHGDMFQIPKGAEWLASSCGCPHQAMRIGRYAYGLQFHLEITDRSIREWTEEYLDQGDTTLIAQRQKMVDDYQNKKERFKDVADKIYENFLKIIAEKNTTVNAKARL